MHTYIYSTSWSRKKDRSVAWTAFELNATKLVRVTPGVLGDGPYNTNPSILVHTYIHTYIDYRHKTIFLGKTKPSVVLRIGISQELLHEVARFSFLCQTNTHKPHPAQPSYIHKFIENINYQCFNKHTYIHARIHTYVHISHRFCNRRRAGFEPGRAQSVCR